MSASDLSHDKKKGGIKIAGITALTVVVLGMAGTIIYLLNANKAEEQPEKRNIVVTPENVDEIVQEMKDAPRVDPGYFITSMNYEWYFETGDAVSTNAFVRNHQENKTPVFFDVVLADNEDDVIYQSPVLPVGSSLEQIALDKKMDAGTYDCIVIFHLIDDDQNTLSTLRVTATIIIEK